MTGSVCPVFVRMAVEDVEEHGILSTATRRFPAVLRFIQQELVLGKYICAFTPVIWLRPLSVHHTNQRHGSRIRDRGREDSAIPQTNNHYERPPSRTGNPGTSTPASTHVLPSPLSYHRTWLREPVSSTLPIFDPPVIIHGSDSRMGGSTRYFLAHEHTVYRYPPHAGMASVNSCLD